MSTQVVYEITHNLDEKSPRISQPDKILISLKEHQKSIIYRARQLEELKPFNIENNRQMITQFGVICDHVGAGKSYEVLGTIASTPTINQHLKLHSFSTGSSYVIYDNYVKIDTNIIVVPHGVFKQWEEYISKFTKLKSYSINTFQHLKSLLNGYKIDELYDPEDPIDEPLILNLIKNMRSNKVESSSTTKTKKNKKDDEPSKPTPSQVRDTKYYRYLDPYYENISDIEKILDQYGNLDSNKLKGYEVVLISASLYNEFAFYMNKGQIKFKKSDHNSTPTPTYFVNRLIFDEADSINIPNNIRINALFYWFVTSSFTSLCNPDGIEKSVVEKKNHIRYGQVITSEIIKKIREKGIKCTGFIKDLFKKVEGDPDRLNYYLKNDDAFIEMSFKLPEISEHLLICRDNVQIKILNGVVSNDVLLMLNAGDTESAINRVSCEKGTEDNIISVVTQRLEQKILEFKDELRDKQNKEYVTPKAKQEALERTQQKITETRNKIKLIEERIKGVECCDICFDDITNPAVTNCCQNVFCFACLAIAISGKNLCPKCRCSLTLDNIMLIKNDKNKDEDSKKKAVETASSALKTLLENANANDKYTNLEKIIEYKMKFFPKEKRKILIFSEHEGSFNAKMTGILDNFKINYSRIKGTSASINKTLREYRGVDLKPGDQEIDILLINSRFFGAGLNLQNSSDIIILHRQGADLLHQIIGRAQRIGRKDSLNVWKLYHNNEAYNYVE
jgi:hypothetical protein